MNDGMEMGVTSFLNTCTGHCETDVAIIFTQRYTAPNVSAESIVIVVAERLGIKALTLLSSVTVVFLFKRLLKIPIFLLLLYAPFYLKALSISSLSR
jgi:hypothetical protein